MKSKLPGNIIGIDTGQTGAAVSLDGHGKLLDFIDMPIVQAPNSKAKIVDGYALREFLVRNNPSLIVIEMVASRPMQGVATTFQFGMSYGAALAVALSVGCEVVLVTAAKWTGRMNLRGGKKQTLQWAAKLHPDYAHAFKRVTKDIGRSDAAAIAEYGRRYCR